MSIVFTGENRFALGPFTFIQEWTDRINDLSPDFPSFVIMKTRDNLASFVRQFERYGRPVGTLLELGVMKGGSCAFFSELMKPNVHVSIDYNPNKLTQLEKLQSYGGKTGRTYRHFPGVMQQDTDRILSLVAQTTSCPVDQVVFDWIIDDASHFYGPTKAAFNGLFPYLSEGGVYAIEDWAWAHWQPWQGDGALWESEAALTNLIFEICMAHATAPGLIHEVVINPVTVYVIRGDAILRDRPFDISSSYVARGRTLRPL